MEAQTTMTSLALIPEAIPSVSEVRRALRTHVTPAEQRRLVAVRAAGGALEPTRVAFGAALGAWTRAGRRLMSLGLVEVQGWRWRLTALGAALATAYAERAELRQLRAQGWRLRRVGYYLRIYARFLPDGSHVAVWREMPGAPWTWAIGRVSGRSQSLAAACAAVTQHATAVRTEQRGREAHEARKAARGALHARAAVAAAYPNIPPPPPPPPPTTPPKRIRRGPRRLRLPGARWILPVAQMAASVLVLLQLTGCGSSAAHGGTRWAGPVMLAVSVLGLCLRPARSPRAAPLAADASCRAVLAGNLTACHAQHRSAPPPDTPRIGVMEATPERLEDTRAWEVLA